MKIKTLVVTLSLLLAVTFSSITGTWEQDSAEFVENHHPLLRSTRSKLERSSVPLVQAVEILDFLVKSRNTYGAANIACTPQMAQLMVDVCDIVNLQSYDFKKRYDVYVEQWEDRNQIPFSLFTFDRIAQVFHYQEKLFDLSGGSSYLLTLENILLNDIPTLRKILNLIWNLSMPNPLPQEEANIMELMVALEAAAKQPKPGMRKRLRERKRLKNITLISAMAHDYMTLNRIEETVDMITRISAFDNPSQREAFLAGMIQLGELATNKNLSSYLKNKIPTIPWLFFHHIRDSLEHQDEHGFVEYFNMAINARSPINFDMWKDELICLRKMISRKRQKIWKNNPKPVFERWLRRAAAGNPTYGITVDQTKQFKEKDPQGLKVLRKSTFFKDNGDTWRPLLAKKAPSVDNIRRLRQEIDREDKDDLLASYTSLEKYLWNRLKVGATHLLPGERDFLIKVAQEYFDENEILLFCIALLTSDFNHLTQENCLNLMQTARGWEKQIERAPIRKIVDIYQKFRVTRDVTKALKFDDTKAISQENRKKLVKRMFERTSEHLHHLSHGPGFEKRLFQEIMTIPVRYAFDQEMKINPHFREIAEKAEILHRTDAVTDRYGYANLTSRGMVEFQALFENSGQSLKFPEINADLIKYGRKVINRFYQAGHEVHLPTAIKEDTVTYLASIYSLSVGIGALKEWVARENGNNETEAKTLEKLRDGRNFMAHGDLLRTMYNVQLTDILESLLMGHLENSQELKFCSMSDEKIMALYKDSKVRT